MFGTKERYASSDRKSRAPGRERSRALSDAPAALEVRPPLLFFFLSKFLPWVSKKAVPHEGRYKKKYAIA